MTSFLVATLILAAAAVCCYLGGRDRAKHRSLWAVALLALALSPLPGNTGCASIDTVSAASDGQEVTPSQAWYATKSDLLTALAAAEIAVEAESTPLHVKIAIAKALSRLPDLERIDAAVLELGDDPSAQAIVLGAVTLVREILTELAASGVFSS